METLTPQRWTRLEYERLIEKGIFRPDDRLEPIGGLACAPLSEPAGE